MLLALALVTQAPRSFGEVVTLQLAKSWSAQDVWVADLDGDGELDVVVSAADPKKSALRSLSVFRARATAPRLASTPDPVLELTPDVVAWAAGDVDPARGEELVLFSARGAFAWRPAEKPEQRFARLCELDFLWQLPDADECWAYPAALRDLDGDKRLDLVLPEPDGYAVALRAHAPAQGFGKVDHLRLPDDAFSTESLLHGKPREANSSPEGRRIELKFGDEADVRGPRALLSVSEKTPAPQLLDFDADGRLDLLAQGATKLYVWTQKQDGELRRRAALRVPAARAGRSRARARRLVQRARARHGRRRARGRGHLRRRQAQLRRAHAALALRAGRGARRRGADRRGAALRAEEPAAAAARLRRLRRRSGLRGPRRRQAARPLRAHGAAGPDRPAAQRLDRDDRRRHLRLPQRERLAGQASRRLLAHHDPDQGLRPDAHVHRRRQRRRTRGPAHARPARATACPAAAAHQGRAGALRDAAVRDVARPAARRSASCAAPTGARPTCSRSRATRCSA